MHHKWTDKDYWFAGIPAPHVRASLVELPPLPCETHDVTWRLSCESYETILDEVNLRETEHLLRKQDGFKWLRYRVVKWFEHDIGCLLVSVCNTWNDIRAWFGMEDKCAYCHQHRLHFSNATACPKIMQKTKHRS